MPVLLIFYDITSAETFIITTTQVTTKSGLMILEVNQEAIIFQCSKHDCRHNPETPFYEHDYSLQVSTWV